jgi:hypothetical protein
MPSSHYIAGRSSTLPSHHQRGDLAEAMNPEAISAVQKAIYQCRHKPLCRHHHRCKQAEGWRLEQPEPGVLVWHTPTGRNYATTPTQYPA